MQWKCCKSPCCITNSGRYITVAVIVGFREIKERRETDGWCRMGTAPYPKRNRLENAFADCARVPSRSGDT